jgi:signal transduction histidine kinase
VLEGWKGSIASGEPFDMVFPLRGADGQFRPFLTRVMPVRGEDGMIVHWFGTNTDISDRLRIEDELKAAKDEAEAANRAKDQFLAVLSHELRTPLNPILLAVSSMLERTPEPEELHQNLEMIRQNVNLQARLIDDLLDVSWIVRGKMPLHWEVADAHALIRQAVTTCRSEVFGKGLRLDMDLGAQGHHVNADPARFQQVIWNLVKNAVKYTPGGGAILIRTSNEDGEAEERLVIEVGDTGIGIEPEIMPLIFDPFQQGETKITRKFGGLGLGLAICRGIVDSHGWTLTAESEGRDRGTTFRITSKTTPSPAATDGESSGDSPVSPPAALPSLKILMVEDEPARAELPQPPGPAWGGRAGRTRPCRELRRRVHSCRPCGAGRQEPGLLDPLQLVGQSGQRVLSPGGVAFGFDRVVADDPAEPWRSVGSRAHLDCLGRGG